MMQAQPQVALLLAQRCRLTAQSHGSRGLRDTVEPNGRHHAVCPVLPIVGRAGGNRLWIGLCRAGFSKIFDILPICIREP